MSLDDGRERLQHAVQILVEEKDRIKQRLLVAYASQLSLIDARHDLPQELTNNFYSLRNALSDAEMPYGLGKHAAEKIQAMSDDEASELAGKIFSLFLEFCGSERTHRKSGVEDVGKSPTVTDFVG